MKSLSELLQELKLLPIGNIYKKTIHGKSYFYYQYFKSGKRYTEKISDDFARTLKPQIEKRKEIEKEIKLLKAKEKTLILSNSSNNLSGQIMNGDVPVAKFENGVLVDMNEEMVPLVIKRTHSIEKFLELRTIDMSRTNARILKKALNIQTADDYKIPLYTYALSVSDNYWFKPKHSKTSFEVLRFNSDSFSDMALKGDTSFFPAKASLTPELTTTGSFEKGWKLINGVWWLYKSGNNKQLFSELLCYEFATLIGIKTAKYEYADGYIRSKNFAEKYNYEPIAALADDNDNYEYVFNILVDMNESIAKDYLKIIFFDSVIYNLDRHNENLGLLRSKLTGKIYSLAPNFDNNLALISTVDTLSAPSKDKFIELFIKFLNKNERAKELFNKISFPDISKEDISECIKKVPILINNSNELIDSIFDRYYYVKDYFK